MGDEQQGQAPDLADEAPARKWGDPLDLLDEERKTALAEAVWEWMPAQATPEQSGPFAWQRLDGLEVFWLAACVVAGRGGDTAAIAQRLAGDTFTDRYSIDLSGLHLEGAILNRAHLAGSNLYMAHLEGADLYGAHLAGAYLVGAHLEGTTLSEAHLEGADLGGAHLEGANLRGARLEGGRLGAHLAGAVLAGAHLEGANLRGARLEAKTFTLDDPEFQRIRAWAAVISTVLPPADFRGVFFDPATEFSDTTWTDPVSDHATGPWLADVRWGGANLTVIEWEGIARLQDERGADAPRFRGEAPKPPERETRVIGYQAAGRAYRLLFVALRAQGLTTPATRYHFRAEVVDRKALWHRHRYGRWLFSWLLGTFAGYGDYIGRLFMTYAAVIVTFALAMFAVAGRFPSLDTIGDVLILSVTSFHGRGVQPPGLHLSDGLAALSGVEAVFGLLIEGLFIAAFTRRVTGG